MSNEPTAARTPGATRAGARRIRVRSRHGQQIMGGPAYSTAHGPCVEGDRMIVGLMRMPAGTGAEPHSHPNEQWIYILKARSAPRSAARRRGEARHRALHPGQPIHSGKATPRATWSSSR